MNIIPESITRYLKDLDGDQCADGYLCLNDKQEILANCGFVGVSNSTTIGTGVNAVQSIPVLEGLLPNNVEEPSVIYCVHIDNDYYFDIHFFHDNVGSWVLFIDSTSRAKKMQQEQQTRLTEDFKNDNRRTGN